MRPSRLLLTSLIPLLGGCDLLIAGLVGPPGTLPGMGPAIEGIVLDAATQLPVGGATVVSGLGSALSDATGRFKLYGAFGSHELSASRYGYTGVTDGEFDASAGDPVTISLAPYNPPESSLPTRFLKLDGNVTGLDAAGNGLVSFGGLTASVSNAAYQIEFKAQVPGRILTSVLAWGTISGKYHEGVAAAQPFNFTNFGYDVRHWPLGETIPESRQTMNLPIRADAPIQAIHVNYGNTTGFASVQTDILLDFGVAGDVPVATQTSSNQDILVPKVPGLKYVVVGEARDASGKGSSAVMITTNDPSAATFPLLPLPKVTEPSGAGAGSRPTFKWSASTAKDVAYQVTLYEIIPGVSSSKAKWVGVTRAPEITYPGFSQSDINGGALRTEYKYRWNLRVIDILGATDLASSKNFEPDAAYGLLGTFFPQAPSVKPFRVRKREAQVIDTAFTP